MKKTILVLFMALLAMGCQETQQPGNDSTTAPSTSGSGNGVEEGKSGTSTRSSTTLASSDTGGACAGVECTIPPSPTACDQRTGGCSDGSGSYAYANGAGVVSAGFFHTCAVTSTGALKCWGYNEYAQLGNSSTTDSLIPVNVTGLSFGVASVNAGDLHTSAVTSASLRIVTPRAGRQHRSRCIGEGT